MKNQRGKMSAAPDCAAILWGVFFASAWLLWDGLNRWAPCCRSFDGQRTQACLFRDAAEQKVISVHTASVQMRHQKYGTFYASRT